MSKSSSCSSKLKKVSCSLLAIVIIITIVNAILLTSGLETSSSWSAGSPRSWTTCPSPVSHRETNLRRWSSIIPDNRKHLVDCEVRLFKMILNIFSSFSTCSRQWTRPTRGSKGRRRQDSEQDNNDFLRDLTIMMAPVKTMFLKKLTEMAGYSENDDDYCRDHNREGL